jgi:hypothetical protein
MRVDAGLVGKIALHDKDLTGDFLQHQVEHLLKCQGKANMWRTNENFEARNCRL